jgi:hypothetical protein
MRVFPPRKNWSGFIPPVSFPGKLSEEELGKAGILLVDDFYDNAF